MIFGVQTYSLEKKVGIFRGSKIEVFGPFDPPKQLTFKQVAETNGRLFQAVYFQVEDRVLKAVRSWDRFPADKESLLKLDADLSKDFGFDSLDQVISISK